MDEGFATHLPELRSAGQGVHALTGELRRHAAGAPTEDGLSTGHDALDREMRAFGARGRTAARGFADESASIGDRLHAVAEHYEQVDADAAATLTKAYPGG
jgi:hypothetical protein